MPIENFDGCTELDPSPPRCREVVCLCLYRQALCLQAPVPTRFLQCKFTYLEPCCLCVVLEHALSGEGSGWSITLFCTDTFWLGTYSVLISSMSECCVDCWYVALEESADGTEVHPRLPLGQINRHSGVASHQIISGVMELLLEREREKKKWRTYSEDKMTGACKLQMRCVPAIVTKSSWSIHPWPGLPAMRYGLRTCQILSHKHPSLTDKLGPVCATNVWIKVATLNRQIYRWISMRRKPCLGAV